MVNYEYYVLYEELRVLALLIIEDFPDVTPRLPAIFELYNNRPRGLSRL